MRWFARRQGNACDGIPCVVSDSLVRGQRELVADADLIVGDIADSALVRQIIEERYDIEFEMIGYDKDNVRIICSAFPTIAPGQIAVCSRAIRRDNASPETQR